MLITTQYDGGTMEGIYRWVQNITYYMIFITAAAICWPIPNMKSIFAFLEESFLVLLVVQPFNGESSPGGEADLSVSIVHF